MRLDDNKTQVEGRAKIKLTYETLIRYNHVPAPPVLHGQSSENRWKPA